MIQKKVRGGEESLTAWERLVYAIWVADYGMRNAEDLTIAKDLCDDFRSVATEAATAMSFKFTGALFSMEPRDIEAKYFELFDIVCDEVRAGKPA